MNKLDLIIEALEIAWGENLNLILADKYVKALVAARELRDMKPVAWLRNDGERTVLDEHRTMYPDGAERFSTSLYALGESND